MWLEDTTAPLGEIPDRATRLKIDQQVTKSAREHFVIYADQPSGPAGLALGPPRAGQAPGQPRPSFRLSQSGDSADPATGTDRRQHRGRGEHHAVRCRRPGQAAFDVDKVTKKFYDRFKAEHAAFLKFIKGIKAEADLQWYTSLMLNRLMFVYFIQKKGFLDGDTDYLRNRLRDGARRPRARTSSRRSTATSCSACSTTGLGKRPTNASWTANWRSCSARFPS